MKRIVMLCLVIVMTIFISSMLFPVANCKPSRRRYIFRRRPGLAIIHKCSYRMRKMCLRLVGQCTRLGFYGRKRRSISDEEGTQKLNRAKRRATRVNRIRVNCRTCKSCW